MNRPRACVSALISLISLISLTVTNYCHAVDGRVIDAETGKPLAGVDVIGTWKTSGGVVISSTGCARLDITRTDPEGRFKLPSSTGKVFSKAVGDEGLDVYYYKRGYRWKNPAEGHDGPIIYRNGEEWREPVMMERDHSAVMQRLELIGKLGGKTDCGALKDRRKAVPLLRRMQSEADSIAETNKDRERAIHMTYWVDEIEFGETRAGALLERRLQELRPQR